MSFKLGDVVCVNLKLNESQTIVSFGVIVRLPILASLSDPTWGAGHRYRVRVSTRSFSDFIEVGALAHEMSKT